MIKIHGKRILRNKNYKENQIKAFLMDLNCLGNILF